MNELDEKMFQEFETKKELVKVEKNLIDSTIDDFQEIFNQKKSEMIFKLDMFKDKYMYEDSNGKLKSNIKGSTSLVISEYFFKPLIPILGIEPKYSAEKISIAFEIYRYIVSEVNSNIGKFIPNKTHFCRFIGITTTTYNNYMKSSDENLQNAMIMIDDYMLDANLTSSQNREVDSVTTIFRAKVEQNKQEQPAQQTVVIADTVDVNLIQQRIRKLNGIREARIIDDNE